MHLFPILLEILSLLALAPPSLVMAVDPDPDGDGFVTIADCNATHLCTSDTTCEDGRKGATDIPHISTHSSLPAPPPRAPVYYCPASYYAKQATVRVEEGSACTTFEQCEAFPELCGSECDNIAVPNSGNEEGWGSGGSDEDNLAWCDELDRWSKQFFSGEDLFLFGLLRPSTSSQPPLPPPSPRVRGA